MSDLFGAIPDEYQAIPGNPQNSVQRYKLMGDGTYSPVVALGVPPTGGPTIRTNAGSVSPGQSLKTYTGTIVLSTTLVVLQPIETVTAGKVFYITDINISANNANQFLVQIQAGGVDIFDTYIKGDTAPCSFPGIESQPNAPAGSAVQIRFSIVPTATSASFFIAGFEQ